MLYFVERNEQFKIIRSDLIFQDRDFVVLRFNDNTIQPFYRSTGRNSGKPGTWFPFDGIIIKDGWRLWFNKRRFTSDDELHRYGTEQHRLISEHLTGLNIERGNVNVDRASYERVNRELGVEQFTLAALNIDEKNHVKVLES